MSLIVLYFLHITSVLAFYIDVVLTRSIGPLWSYKTVTAFLTQRTRLLEAVFHSANSPG